MQRKSRAKENSSVGITCTSPWRLNKVVPLNNYQLQVEFIDGTVHVAALRVFFTSCAAALMNTIKCYNY